MPLKIIHPYDQRVFQAMAFDGPLEREKKIRRAFQTVCQWRRLPLSERIT